MGPPATGCHAENRLPTFGTALDTANPSVGREPRRTLGSGRFPTGESRGAKDGLDVEPVLTEGTDGTILDRLSLEEVDDLFAGAV